MPLDCYTFRGKRYHDKGYYNYAPEACPSYSNQRKLTKKQFQIDQCACKVLRLKLKVHGRFYVS